MKKYAIKVPIKPTWVYLNNWNDKNKKNISGEGPFFSQSVTETLIEYNKNK